MHLMKPLLFAVATATTSMAALPPEDFANAAATAAAAAETATIAGDAEGWLFVRNELAMIGEGKFWDSFQGRDPVKVIGGYQKALAELGVELVVAPVPAKAALYPEKFQSSADLTSVTPMKPLLDQIAATGTKVVDLESVYRAELANGALYCAQDAHWTPLGAKRAAEEIAKQLPEIAAAGTASFTPGAPAELEITGDQARGKFADLPKEIITTYPVAPAFADDATSPVLVVGDSHLQVFTDGGAQFHCTASGFLDHLQHALKTPLTSMKNSGDGVDGPRIRIVKAARKDPDYWGNKKAVVWVFSARAFTSAIQKWREVPPKQ